jgi:hypothetical protein
MCRRYADHQVFHHFPLFFREKARAGVEGRRTVARPGLGYRRLKQFAQKRVPAHIFPVPFDRDGARVVIFSNPERRVAR